MLSRCKQKIFHRRIHGFRLPQTGSASLRHNRGARPISALNMTTKTLNPFLNELEGLGASLTENGAADLEDASVHSTIIHLEK